MALATVSTKLGLSVTLGIIGIIGVTLFAGCGAASDLNVDPDDPPGTTGTTGNEEPDCLTNADCGSGAECVLGECVSDDGLDPDQCYEDADCPAGEMCVNRECHPGFPALEPCAPLVLGSADIVELTAPFAWTVGDVDGEPGDEIVAYHQAEIVSVANGQLTITPHPVPWGAIRSAVLLRADDDAAPDLIVSGTSLHTFMGDGAGGFVHAGSRKFAYEFGELTKAAAPTSDALIGKVAFSSKHDVFLDALALVPSFTLSGFDHPTAGDLDGDGVDEIVVADGDTIEIWARDEDGYARVKSLDCAVGGAISSPVPVLADVDGDGLRELVCLSEFWPNGVVVSLWSNLGGLAFERQPTVFADHASVGQPAGLADLEGDGDPEFVFGYGSFMRLGEHGNFACSQQLDVTGDLVVADVDGDGQHELVSVGNDRVLRVHALE